MGALTKASEYFNAIVSGYPSRLRPEKWLMFLQAYIDDSDSAVGDNARFLAGYVLDSTKWAEFSDEWDAVLRAHPAIGYFHAVEAQNLRGEFRGWSVEQKDEKVIALAKVVRKYQPWSIQCSVNKSDFDAIFRPVAPYFLQDPYFINFYGIIMVLAYRHNQRGITIPVDFIFDEKGGLGTNALVWYDHIKGLQIPDIKPLLGGTPAFKDDKAVMPLQAADMLAWNVRREAEERVPPDNLVAMGFLLGDNHRVVSITKDDLQSFAEAMSGIEGLERFRAKKSWLAVKSEVHRRLSLGLGPDD